jgi:chemotaxis protein methyltransferase WspC
MGLEVVLNLLRERIGLAPEALGNNVVAAALETRRRALDLPDLAATTRRVQQDAEEFAALVDDVVVPETWFFRGGALFDELAARAGQHIRNGRVFRALSAPCSSGEEPYSLAIALHQAGLPKSSWSIDGIDLSRRALDRANRAIYASLSFRQTAPALRQKYFRQVSDGWELQAPMLGSVRFQQGNVITPWFMADEKAYDLVLCRNLVIYLLPAARRLLLDALARLVASGGLLCVGYAEPLSLTDDRFRPVGPGEFFMYQRQPVATGGKP